MFEDREAAESNLKRLTDIVWPATRSIILSQFEQQLAEASAKRTADTQHADFVCEHSALYSALCDGSLDELLQEYHTRQIPLAHLQHLLPAAAGAALEDDEAPLTPPSLPLLLPQPVLFLEAAVLLQAQWDAVMDAVWCTTVPSAVAVQRVMHRNSMSKGAAEARVAAQVSEMHASADRVHVTIDTHGDKHVTRQAVADCWLRLVHSLHNGRGAQVRSGPPVSPSGCRGAQVRSGPPVSPSG